MRNLYTYSVFAALVIAALATPLAAQTAAQERAAKLREQLADVQSEQTELQTQLQQVENDLNPENIEKGLAGVGSTKPEELREQRRRQLEIQRKTLQTRLDRLASSRTRLETGIAQADAEVYHRSADGPIAVTQESDATQQTAAQGSTPSSTRRRSRTKKRKPQSRRTQVSPQDQHHPS